MQTTYTALGLAILALCVRRLIRYWQILGEVRGVPTIHCGFQTFEGFFRTFLPHILYIFPVKAFTIRDPYQTYENARSTLIAIAQADSPYAAYLVGSGALAARVFADTATFHKTESIRRRLVRCFGENVVTAQTGPEHRKHRNIVKACFGEGILKGVWDAATESFDVMMEGCRTVEGGRLKDVQGAMNKFTMRVFGKAGFGDDWPWETPSAKDGDMTLAEAFRRFEHSAPAQLLLPLKIMQYSPLKSMRGWGKTQVSLLQHIDDLVAERRAKPIDDHKDILSALVASQEATDDRNRLTQNEVFSNVWVFLLAEHETTSNTLTFLLAFLAFHPDVQEKMFREIEATQGDYTDVTQLKYCLNCIYETLRLRDTVQYVSKEAIADVTVTYHIWDGPRSGVDTKRTLVPHTHLIEAGSRVYMDSSACSMDPAVYPEPHAFKPERWDDPALKATFTPFALGLRGCIGRRFAEVEMLAFVCRLVKAFRVEPVRLAGETEEEMSQRYMAVKEKITLGSVKWDLELVGR